MLQVGILVSGGGTNLQAIIDACDTKLINVEIAAVVSDNEKAFALQRAENHGINGYFIDASNKKKHEKKIDRIFESENINLVVGAGYMRILSPSFIKRWYGKLINIHPALLPSFKGIDGQKQALDYGVKIAGCTTHFMDEKPDHGPIILQAAIKINDADTLDKLIKKILRVEYQILPRSIDLYEKGRLQIEGRKVKILPGDSWLGRYSYQDVVYSEGY